MQKLTSQSNLWEISLQLILAIGTMALGLLILILRIAVPIAAIIFIIWLLCGGALWKGKPADLPAAQAITSLVQ